VKSNDIWFVLILWCLVLVFCAYFTWDYLLSHHDKIRNLALVAGALIGAPVVLWRTTIAHEESLTRDRDTKIREGDLKTRQQDANTNNANVVTGAYTQAIDHLSANKSNGVINLQTRLSAIYALAQIAKQNESYSSQIVAVLASYVSEETFFPPPPSFPEGLSFPRFFDEEGEDNPVFDYPRTYSVLPRADIQAIFTVFSQGSKGWVHRGVKKGTELQLSNCYLAGVRFQPKGYSCYFSRCDLTNADLSGSYFLNRSSFTNCSLVDATLKETRLNFCSWKDSILSGANFEFADIRNRLQLTERQMQGVDLRQTQRDLDFACGQDFPDNNHEPYRTY
jgi:hypothetical protein